jgi:hypothetical protein
MTHARSENIEKLKNTIKSLENELAQMKSVVRRIPPSVLKDFNTDLTAGLVKVRVALIPSVAVFTTSQQGQTSTCKTAVAD